MCKKLQLFSCLLLSFILSDISYAQQVPSTMHAELEVGAYVSNTTTNPFWIRSNQYGEVPLESNGFSARAQVKKEYAPLFYKKGEKNKFSYGYGIRGVFNSGITNQLILSEAYAKIRYGAVEISGGRRRQISGLVDSTLSSGAYLVSGNSLPIPKVEISIPNFTPITKNGLIAVKGNYAYGWFGTGDSVQNYYLHQNSIYVRIGKPSWRFKLYGGVNHQVQWGGSLLYPRVDRGVQITQFGSDLKSYWYAVSGKSLYTLDTLIVKNNSVTSDGGGGVGNHLATVDVAIEYESYDSKWLLYRQSINEAVGLLTLNNITDGLNGLSFTRKNATNGIVKVVLEYLQTSDQGGPIAGNRTKNAQVKGREDYYNDGRYIDGWVYKGQTIGTPFLMPLRYNTGLPQNLDPNPNRIVNNRVNAIILGVLSRIDRVELLSRVSYSENLGNYNLDYPINTNQLSVQQRIIVPIGKLTITGVFAYDSKGVLQENIGGSLFAKISF